MDLLYDVLVAAHLLGMAILVGGYAAQVARRAGAAPDVLMIWGARLQVLTGLAMVGIAEALLDDEVNHTKIGVKLAVAVLVAALVEIGGGRARRGEVVPAGVLHGAGVLAILNVLIAVLW